LVTSGWDLPSIIKICEATISTNEHGGGFVLVVAGVIKTRRRMLFWHVKKKHLFLKLIGMAFLEDIIDAFYT
jgi:hypothetical protein